MIPTIETYEGTLAEWNGHQNAIRINPHNCKDYDLFTIALLHEWMHYELHVQHGILNSFIDMKSFVGIEC